MSAAAPTTALDGGLLRGAGLETAGKALVALLFWWSGVAGFMLNWPGSVRLLAMHYVPLPELAAALAATIEMVVPLGLFRRALEPAAALILAAYCVMTALMFHAFWTLPEGMQAAQSTHFFKNLALAGALTVLAARPISHPSA